MQPEKLMEALQEAAQREQQRLAAAAIETQIKVLSATYDKSMAYTNLIILAAYAGFFGLWQVTKEYLSKQAALWSALLMLVSIVTFIAFEVVKMVLIQHNFMGNSPTSTVAGSLAGQTSTRCWSSSKATRHF